MVAHAATADDIEELGVAFQKESIDLIEKKLKSSHLAYISSNIMTESNATTISKEIKSNRMWGFGSIDQQEIQSYFASHPDV